MNKSLSILILALFCTGSLLAQKKPLDHSVYDTWKSVGVPTMSHDGKFSLYPVSAVAGDGYLMQSNLLTGDSFAIDRANMPFITLDSKYAVCRIAPLYEETNRTRTTRARPEDTPKDTMCIWTLGKTDLKKIPFVSSFMMAEEGNLCVAFRTQPPADTSKKVKTPTRERGEGSDLMLYYFATNKIDTLKSIADYRFNQEGTQLFLVRKLNSKDSSQTQDGLFLYNLVTKTEQALLTGPRKSRFFLPVSDKDKQFFAFYANIDTTKSAERSINIYFFKKGDAQATLMVDTSTKGLPDNWNISQSASLAINKTGTRLFFGISPKPPEKDTTKVDSETPKLDIWHYLDDYIQPVQLSRGSQDQRNTYLSYLSIQNPQEGLFQLATPEHPDIRIPNDWSAEWGYATDDKPYRIQSQWSTDAPLDLYFIGVADGKAKKIATGACLTNFSTSPQGKYLVWYDKSARHWFSYEAASGILRNLTEKIPVAFWDESDDTPQLPSPYGSFGWREADAALLIYDQYDIWEVDPAGIKAPVVLTEGLGRKQEYTFRLFRLSEEGPFKSSDPLTPNETLYFNVFDNVTKNHGFYLKEQGKRQAQMQCLVLDGYTYLQLRRSKDGKIFTFTKSNFAESPNFWITRDRFKTKIRLSDINPQQKEYNWGTAELVHWTSANGIPCDGILYKPEDFDPNKKYPMIVYFYETVSEKLHTYIKPALIGTSINITYYVSNGYLVFTPDIHYTMGHPGQSAMNCIMPGVDMLCKNPWVDEENMAIQGHSWGGYQVAYMITQTNRFKAAEAGAPVTNMTSAYGAIRSESGKVRQFQYESTQSRIGQNLWDGFDRYIENSPVFYAQNVTTPLLIMHNDKDGAVPWAQGIEYFTALRRLGKPVWMLQYNNEGHSIGERRNRIDFTTRLAQFFDHFLKGAPAPIWIKDGVPATKKGVELGLGYE